MLVFKSKSSYKPFALPNAAGYFQKGQDVNYITLSTETYADNPFGIIYHEYVHLMVDNTVGNVPAWFNEGLAEYYSTFAIEEDRKVHLGELIPYHLMTLREEKLLPLRKLFAVDHYSPEYNEKDKKRHFLCAVVGPGSLPDVCEQYRAHGRNSGSSSTISAPGPRSMTLSSEPSKPTSRRWKRS